MYAATILLFLSMPLVLGSIISFLVFLVYPIIIAKRIKNEEEVLEKELEGYSEYKNKVKYWLTFNEINTAIMMKDLIPGYPKSLVASQMQLLHYQMVR